MSTNRKRLHNVPPREQVGAGTDPKYEYQYTQAAIASLLLFDDALCLYCEWHDDYVLEHEGPSPPVYRFHQVKTRGLKQGPWKLADLFGIKKSKKPQNQGPPTDEPFQYMLEHALTFADGCDRIVFVTNNEVEDDIHALLADVKATTDPSTLSKESREWFERILTVHLHVQPSLTEAVLFGVLQRLYVLPLRGNPEDGEKQLIELGVKIAELSEVPLLARQAVRMGRDILDLVRAKSGIKIEPVPIDLTDADLRASKAILVEDLLKLISLSPEGYQILRGAKDTSALRNLSRLQRYCEANNIGSELIQEICSYKAAWDTWLISEKARVQGTDLASLIAETGNLLTAYASLPKKKKSLAWFVPEARDLAKRYAPKFNSVTALSEEAALGLIFKIAADRGKP